MLVFNLPRQLGEPPDLPNVGILHSPHLPRIKKSEVSVLPSARATTCRIRPSAHIFILLDYSIEPSVCQWDYYQNYYRQEKIVKGDV